MFAETLVAICHTELRHIAEDSTAASLGYAIVQFRKVLRNSNFIEIVPVIYIRTYVCVFTHVGASKKKMKTYNNENMEKIHFNHRKISPRARKLHLHIIHVSNLIPMLFWLTERDILVVDDKGLNLYMRKERRQVLRHREQHHRARHGLSEVQKDRKN
jgi:hypothetical protein